MGARDSFPILALECYETHSSSNATIHKLLVQCSQHIRLSVRKMKSCLLWLAVVLFPQIRTEPCPCNNGGTCANNATTCVCPPTYTGANCSDLVGGDCSQVHCQNAGSCINGICVCAPGYTDSNCTTVINNCVSQPCLNGGTCSNEIDSYTCTCLPGFTDSNCSTLVDNCVSQPCKNGGTCTNEINSYTCACPPGFTDSNCNTIIDNCVSQPCQNGGTCTNGINTHTCTCALGYTDASCSTNINYCSPQPCTNGGTCVNGIGSFTCQCPPTWGGLDCSTRVCPAEYCLNGGTCTVTLGITIGCRCPINTEGVRCEFVNEVTDFVIQAGACTADYCKNGGTCVPATNATAILCRCPPNTAGDQCELANQVPAFDGVKTGLIIASSLGAALIVGIIGFVLFRYAQSRVEKRQRTESKTSDIMLGNDKDSLLQSGSDTKDNTSAGRYKTLGQQ